MTFGRTKPTKPLKIAHARILQNLSNGPTKAMFFEEDEVDALFRLRPKLIKLVPGHGEAVIEITPEGIVALKMSGAVTRGRN